MKHLVGKQVWLIPTGNNARYSSEFVEAKITKVGRVNVTFVREGWNTDETWRMQDKRSEYYYRLSEENSGFLVFESLAKLAEYKEINSLQYRIEKDVESGKLQKLPLESLREINKLLGLDKQEEK